MSKWDTVPYDDTQQYAKADRINKTILRSQNASEGVKRILIINSSFVYHNIISSVGRSSSQHLHENHLHEMYIHKSIQYHAQKMSNISSSGFATLFKFFWKGPDFVSSLNAIKWHVLT